MQYNQQNLRYWDLFAYSSLRRSTLALSLLWVGVDIVWIGVVYSIQSLGNDMNQTFLLLAVSELLAVILNDSVEGLARTKGFRSVLCSLFGTAAVSGLVAWGVDIPRGCFDQSSNCP